jgi:eukaryotic-like serine/threonine-protein kinase
VAETTPFHYRAFLSYSHRDTAWAKWLHSALESYRVDKDLVGRKTPVGPVPASLRPIFRDREDFSAGHSLTEQTSAALEGAQFMVVLCSPNAARSQYVNEEIRRFKAMRRGDHVIPLIVDGEPGDPERDCFPPALRFKIGADGTLTDEHEEPIAADARPQGDGKDGAKLKLVAGMLGLGLDEIVRRAERARRRRMRNWVTALSILTVSFAGLAVWAEINRREANVQRQHAVAALDAATKTANSLTFGLAVQLRDRAGIPATLVKEILDRALHLQNQLAASGQTSPDLQNSEAAALNETSLTLLTIGDRVGALAAADRARELFEALVTAHPDDAKYLSDFALAYQRLGDALVVAGKRDEALADYRKELAIRQRLAQDNPADAKAQSALAIVGNKIGDVSWQEGKYEDALANYQASVAIVQKLVDGEPANAMWQRELAVCYERLGDAQENLGRHDDALSAFRKRLAIAQLLADADKNNTEWQRDLAIAYNKIGDVLTATHQFDDALVNYRQRLEIAQKLADSDPDNRVWLRDVAMGNNKIGNAMAAVGKKEAALTAYRTGLELEQKLAATDPANATWQRDIFISYAMIGEVLTGERKNDDALSAFQSAAAIGEKLSAADPGNAQWQYDLALANWQLAALGDDTVKRLTLIVSTLQKLKDEKKLGAGQAALLGAAQAELAKRQGQ